MANINDWSLFLYQHNEPILLMRMGSDVWADLSHRLAGLPLQQIDSGLICSNRIRVFPGTFVDIHNDTKHKLDRMYYDGAHIGTLTNVAVSCSKTASLSMVTF